MKRFICRVLDHRFGRSGHNAFWSEMEDGKILFSIGRRCDRCGELVNEHILVRKEVQGGYQ